MEQYVIKVVLICISLQTALWKNMNISNKSVESLLKSTKHGKDVRHWMDIPNTILKTERAGHSYQICPQQIILKIWECWEDGTLVRPEEGAPQAF